MALQFESEIEIIEVMESFLVRTRPPDEIRNELDVNYRVENQSVIVFEIRPVWNNPLVKREYNVAKATFIKKANVWKIFCLKPDLKWHVYKPKAKVKTLKEFVKVINEDKLGCFWG